MSRPAAPRAAQNLPGAILVALSLVASFAAQASPWSPVGPPGGAAYGLAVDPKDANVLYAGAFGGGVWKSTDGGASWSRLAGLPAQETVNAVAVSPADSRTVLAAGFTALWRSADAGATWKKVLDQKVQQPAMTGFAFDPTAPATVYASADNDGFPTGVFKSTDSGATWKPANTGINPNSRVRGVAVALLALGLTGPAGAERLSEPELARLEREAESRPRPALESLTARLKGVSEPGERAQLLNVRAGALIYLSELDEAVAALESVVQAGANLV